MRVTGPLLLLNRDPPGRYLPWLVAFMVYVAALALAGSFVVHNATAHWKTSVHGALTVQIPIESEAEARGAEAAAVIDVLRTTPGVLRAEPVSEEAMMASLSPWLDGVEAVERLPLPQLIEVETVPERIDLSDLRARLQTINSDLVIDDHGRWLSSLVSLAEIVRVMAGAVIGAIAFVTSGAVVVATLSGLGIHRETIEVLHLIGAHDSMVAGQFAARAGTRALVGATAGVAVAVVSLILLGHVAAGIPESIMAEAALGAVHWAVLAVLPLCSALLIMGTTWVTVMRFLAARY